MTCVSDLCILLCILVIFKISYSWKNGIRNKKKEEIFISSILLYNSSNFYSLFKKNKDSSIR